MWMPCSRAPSSPKRGIIGKFHFHLLLVQTISIGSSKFSECVNGREKLQISSSNGRDRLVMTACSDKFPFDFDWTSAGPSLTMAG